MTMAEFVSMWSFGKIYHFVHVAKRPAERLWAKEEDIHGYHY